MPVWRAGVRPLWSAKTGIQHNTSLPFVPSLSLSSTSQPPTLSDPAINPPSQLPIDTSSPAHFITSESSVADSHPLSDHHTDPVFPFSIDRTRISPSIFSSTSSLAVVACWSPPACISTCYLSTEPRRLTERVIEPHLSSAKPPSPTNNAKSLEEATSDKPR